MKRKIARKRRPVAGAAPSWRSVSGGITAPQGYLAAGVAAGIKKGGLDLAVLFSSQPAAGAAVFTLNLVQAAPVLLSKKHLRASKGKVRAVLINSGCANACTGDRGMQDALVSVRSLASHLDIDPREVLVASTGVIGASLPIHNMLKGISAAVSALSSRAGDAAARAIMTTDTCKKTFAVETRVGGKRIRIGGMAKGSGMIHPNLATMLSVICTDVRITPAQLDRIFRRVVERTFNCLTVDGDTSTNDMVAILSNGASGVRIDSSLEPRFEAGLEKVCRELARSIARDGEGASKLIEIQVRGARTFNDARKVAKCIAHSPLVKTAICGEELNWGRILCAAGYSGVQFDPFAVTLSVCRIPVFRAGTPVLSGRSRAERALKGDTIGIELELGEGNHSARVYTCDFTRGYIDINASYIS
jgi:glutamate N-acetyltransferase/amino-acid N-acetyltransferase